MNLRHLKTLITVAEHGTFVGAAEALGLTQSAVSMQIRALEEALSVELFDRTKRPPAMNPYGRALLQPARELLFLADQLSEVVSDKSALTGTVDLGAVPTVLTGILPLALEQLQAQYPRLRIRVFSGLSAELMMRMTRGELDAIVVSEPSSVPAGTVWREVATEPLIVIAPESARGRSEEELLQGLPYIRFSKHAWVGGMIDEELRRRGIRIQEGMELDTLEAIGLLVAHNLGVSIVPQRAIDPFRGLKIKSVPFGRPPLRRKLGVLLRGANPRARIIDSLIEQLMRVSQSTESRPALQG